MAKLRHIALYADDAIAAAHFYRDAFDMSTTWRPGRKRP
jgi:catechol 2,3-dioxygenase-like lactoylglutathione lyase family enzyme